MPIIPLIRKGRFARLQNANSFSPELEILGHALIGAPPLVLDQSSFGKQFSLLGSSSGVGDPTTAVTAPMDTTGATLLVVAIGGFASGAANISDSFGNTWTLASSETDGSAVRIWTYYCVSGTVGAGHTFTTSRSNNFAAICAAAFNGSATNSFVSETSQGTPAGTTIQPGSITPSEPASLLISGIGVNIAGALSIDSGFTLLQQKDGASGNNFGCGLAYKVIPTPVAVNPTWTSTVAAGLAASLNEFKV